MALKKTAWSWRRWIAAGTQDLWVQRLELAGCASWVFTERPQRKQILLEVYVDSRASATALIRLWSGRAQIVDTHMWLKARPTPPTRITAGLQIVHEKPRSSKPVGAQLYIAHGLAFGSGEHGTTYLLLQELSRRENWNGKSVLDLGTGSGVLALATRLFGARKIVATDFDEDAVRTARQNEALNFAKPMIRWQRADVLKLRAKTRYDLVLANIFSGILCEAAPQISASVAPNGELWLSGILRSQADEVVAAYKKQGLQLIRKYTRGKWVMLRLAVSF